MKVRSSRACWRGKHQGVRRPGVRAGQSKRMADEPEVLLKAAITGTVGGRCSVFSTRYRDLQFARSQRSVANEPKDSATEPPGQQVPGTAQRPGDDEQASDGREEQNRGEERPARSGPRCLGKRLQGDVGVTWTLGRLEDAGRRRNGARVRGRRSPRCWCGGRGRVGGSPAGPRSDGGDPALGAGALLCRVAAFTGGRRGGGAGGRDGGGL